jgi:hypothetical protein
MRPLLLSILISLTTVLSAQDALLFTEALAQGKILVTVRGVGGHTGQCVSVHFERLTDKTITVKIPAGHVFEPTDSTQQNIVVLKSAELVLDAKKKFIKIYGACSQSHDASPATGAMFHLGKIAEGNLLKMAQFISDKKLYNEADAQFAVWCMTDSLDPASITHPGLLNMACQLLAIPLPQYKVNYPKSTTATPTARPRPTFVKQPLSFEGVFEYQTNTEKDICVYVQDTAGIKVRTIFEHQKQPPGWAKYSFSFKTTKLPPGIYWVILFADDKAVKKIKIKY